MCKWCIVFVLFLNSLNVMSQTNDTILEGKINRTQLEDYTWYRNGYYAYKPYPSVLEKLLNYPKCSLLVILGTWCSDSHELVPQLMKVADHVGWEKIECIGVNTKKECSTIDLSPFGIEYVPVVMVYYNNKAIGKIVETTQKTIEEDLLEILLQTKP